MSPSRINLESESVAYFNVRLDGETGSDTHNVSRAPMDSNMSAGIVVKSFRLRSLQNGMNRVGGRERDAVTGAKKRRYQHGRAGKNVKRCTRQDGCCVVSRQSHVFS